MASTNASTAPPAASAPQPLHTRILFSPLALAGMLLGAMVSAVLVEWAGMALGIWTLPGADHARQTLIDDISYLNADFTRSLFGQSPVELAGLAAQSASEWVAKGIERMHLAELYQQFRTEGMGIFSKLRWPGLTGERAAALSVPATGLVVTPEMAMQAFFQYFDAALYSIQTVVVRIVVALLTLPAYVLIALACLLDGVVARDIRKFTAANESAFAYHRYRPWAKRFFVVGWYLYIAWPSSIHPNVIFIPSALLCGWAIYNTGKWFKKFF